MTQPTFTEARQINQATGKDILLIDGVRAVGVGFLDPSDESKGPALVVDVEDQLSEGGLRTLGNQIATITPSIPTRISAGVPEKSTDVAAPKKANELQLTGYERFERPIRPGYSVGYQFSNPNDPLGPPLSVSGTAGLIVFNRAGKAFVLSNAHVLNADNGTDGVGNTTQPGEGTGEMDLIGFCKIATRLFPFDIGLMNRFDAALCEILPPFGVPQDEYVDRRYGNFRVDVTEAHTSLRLNWLMKKSSLTSGDLGFPMTNGAAKVDAIDVLFTLDYPNTWLNSPGPNTVFSGGVKLVGANRHDVVFRAGDSGSVWLSDDDKACLLATGSNLSGTFCYSTMVEPLLRKFEVSLLETGLIERQTPVEQKDASIYTEVLSDELLSTVEVIRLPENLSSVRLQAH